MHTHAQKEPSMQPINYHSVDHQLINIPGTPLYRKLVIVGVERSGAKRYLDYLASKTPDIIYEHDPKADGKVFKYGMMLYKKDPGMSMEDFRQGIKDEIIEPVYSKPICTDDKQDYTIDDNGNMVLRKYGFDLDEHKRPGGNLILHKDGTVVRDITGLDFISRHNAFGFYPIEIYRNEFNSRTGRYTTVDCEYNFLDPNGSRVSVNSFRREDPPSITPVNHKFTFKEGTHLFIDKKHGINPTGYVYSDKNEVRFFPSPAALLIANRMDMGEGHTGTGFIADETPYLRAFYERVLQLDGVESKIYSLLKSGKIDNDAYKKITKQLEEERYLIDNFRSTLETDADREVRRQVIMEKIAEDSVM